MHPLSSYVSSVNQSVAIIQAATLGNGAVTHFQIQIFTFLSRLLLNQSRNASYVWSCLASAVQELMSRLGKA